VTIHSSMTTATAPLRWRDIDRRDRKHGFRKCGYHWVISRDGLVERGRLNAEPSLHDSGTDVQSAISICLIGGADANGAPQDNFTEAQRESLKKLVKEINLPVKVITPAYKGA
jgi:N-acetylmuramoyl-L-alanine amidase